MKEAPRGSRSGDDARSGYLRQKRQSLSPVSDEMKAWSSALAAELLDWAQLTEKSFFGFTALYRGKTMFGALPRTRTFRANCIALRFHRADRALRARIGKDPRLAAFDKDKKRWFLFELSSGADLHSALEWLTLAYKAASGGNKTTPRS